MKFLLQVRFNGAGNVIGELPAGEQQQVTAEFAAIRQSPGVLDGNQLQSASTAVTVRVKDGQPQVTKGPPPRRETSSTGTTSTTRQASTRRWPSRRGSRSPGSAGPSRSAPCWTAKIRP
jgi:hypothetical protein